MPRAGFEPASMAREAIMLNRATPPGPFGTILNLARCPQGESRKTERAKTKKM